MCIIIAKQLPRLFGRTYNTDDINRYDEPAHNVRLGFASDSVCW